ncbi:pyridine nucleotide-disulfide oxidoreductase [Dyella solisilvae]|uniref:Pyridine nucleotide-disulfide oxidoreductase n=1 Tax=Dyella solisilvae TaxID=1920168 RepID=A0A370K6J4_9GAMM|nr:FAD/NAD(P)-binding protein [Dyella solisilvae]RDI98275.1 pyridine nucleotide-disulfide oxidoreductase [Dyella solisilvae]
MADIVVIGGGAAGAAAFGELLARYEAGTVHWIVGRQAPGRGIAYGTRDDRHLLNVRAASMGVFAEHGEDFIQHASRQLGQVKGTDFLPRRIFGDFIQAQVGARIDAARRLGRSFRIYPDNACEILPRGEGGYAVRVGEQRWLDAGQVVLAVGALAQRALRTVSPAALDSDAYELDPWRLERHVTPPRRVMVIGTGLTAVDTLLSAAERWPHAELVAVSRHGLWPFTHSPLPLAAYPGQEELNRRLLTCDGSASMVRLVRAAFDEAPESDWRSVIDGMRPVNALLWQRLSHARRRQFLRHARWVWEASRHRMAPASGQAIHQLEEEGRLHAIAARVLAVDGDGPLQVTVRERATQLVSTMQADLVVQATGLDTAVAYGAHALLAQLLRDGLAVADPLQLGVLANVDDQLLTATGAAQPGLYAIGSLLRGNLWECTAMPEIRAAAHRLAVQLSRGQPLAATCDGVGELPRS